MTKQLEEGPATPRNELRGFDSPPRLYHVWFSTKRDSEGVAWYIRTQKRRTWRL